MLIEDIILYIQRVAGPMFNSVCLQQGDGLPHFEIELRDLSNQINVWKMNWETKGN